MLIEEKALRHWIDNFYGYGSWDAPIWFIDYEEGGGDLPEEVAEKLNFFGSLSAPVSSSKLCDIRELYKHVTFRKDGIKSDLFSNLYEYRFGAQATQHGVWKNLISFAHGFNNKESPDRLAYQKNKFATSDEALITFYPLPSPHNHAWYYAWLDMPQFGFLKSRALYEEHMYQERIQHILHHIGQHKPEVVLMFGMNNINAVKKSVQDSFPAAKFKMAKGSKLQTPQHHRADFNGTTLLITTQVPALRHNRIETGFDWYQFGKEVKAGKAELK